MKEIEPIYRENMGQKIKDIKKEHPNAKFYSYSRLDNFNTCKRQYYYTYIDKKPQRDNVYSILGTVAHESLEDLYNGKVDKLNNKRFEEEFTKCQLFNISFPASKYDIAGGYKADMEAFYKVYEMEDKKDKEFYSELGFILKVDDDHYLSGFIDMLILDKNTGEATVIDFKTSSAFKPADLRKKGHQLVLYKKAIEELYGIKVTKTLWRMLKYVTVQVGDYKAKVNIRGREWVSKISTQLQNLMKKQGYDELETTLAVAKAVKSNSIDGLPEDIKSKIKVEIYDQIYDVTPEVENELMEYINTTINDIEAMGGDIEEWSPKVDNFYCSWLCGFGGCDGICQECNKGDE